MCVCVIYVAIVKIAFLEACYIEFVSAYGNMKNLEV
jgi:hypothetical protein